MKLHKWKSCPVTMKPHPTEHGIYEVMIKFKSELSTSLKLRHDDHKYIKANFRARTNNLLKLIEFHLKYYSFRAKNANKNRQKTQHQSVKS